MSGKQLVLITFTGEHASGGVPRWVRDFKAGFPEAKSYCWQDVLDAAGNPMMAIELHEWNKAAALNSWLIRSGKVKKDDIIIVDGFWGKGLEDFPNVISVCHGIWSHLIKEEADAGKEPDFPLHHAVQVDYRKNHLKRGGRLVAVSQFIQHQMEIQWGFESTVINNAIDLQEFQGFVFNGGHKIKRPLIIHGVNDKNNPVKGWDHIQYLKEKMPEADILSLDEAMLKYKVPAKPKQYALSLADRVVIPSAYEGNSYFALEALACNVPVIAYNVGLFYEISKMKEGLTSNAGCLLERRLRSKEETLAGVKASLRKTFLTETNYWNHVKPREVAKNYSIQNFHKQWKDYLKQEFDYD